MTKAKRGETIWSLGLSSQLQTEISAALGAGYNVHNWSWERLPRFADLENNLPLIIFVPLAFWERISENAKELKDLLGEYEIPQKVLLLEPDSLEIFKPDRLLSENFLCALTLPLDGNKIKDCIFKAKEIRAQLDDLDRMSQEILLGREIITEKNRQLSFLNAIMHRERKSSFAETLGVLEDDLKILFKDSEIRAALLTSFCEETKNCFQANLFLHPRDPEPQRNPWVKYLINRLEKRVDQQIESYSCQSTKGQRLHRASAHLPARDFILPLSLDTDEEYRGILLISSFERLNPGKALMRTLSAAARHVSIFLDFLHPVSQSADLTKPFYYARTEIFVPEIKRNKQVLPHGQTSTSQ